MTTLETLLKCHEIVWNYRDAMQDYWPTPAPYDALRFCATETAEAIDADLRLNSKYMRNNDKSLSVQDELADALMMALTALRRVPGWIPDVPPPSWEVDARLGSVEWINAQAARLVYHASYDKGVTGWSIWGLCYAIAEYPGMILPARLTARLERIKWKQTKDKWHLWPDYHKWAYANYRFGQDHEGGEILSFEEWQRWVSEPVTAERAHAILSEHLVPCDDSDAQCACMVSNAGSVT